LPTKSAAEVLHLRYRLHVAKGWAGIGDVHWVSILVGFRPPHPNKIAYNRSCLRFRAGKKTRKAKEAKKAKKAQKAKKAKNRRKENHHASLSTTINGSTLVNPPATAPPQHN
jgi:hypothetical protein